MSFGRSRKCVGCAGPPDGMKRIAIGIVLAFQ